MPASESQLFARLEALGIATQTHEHPAVFTVEEAQALRGTLPGGHCKSLFFKDKKAQLWLVVCLEERAIELRKLERAIGAARLSFGKPELLFETLGVTPGSVTPFALINDTGRAVRVVLDRDMLACNPLNFHPLRNTATTAIAPADLERFIAACGHEPLIVDFALVRPETAH